jgi:hypothetical protein
MAIKAGQILHVANNFVVDRIQTGGPGQLNIPQEKVYELGNYQSVGVVRDIPDLTFNLDCLDVATEIEALLTGSADPSADADGTAYDLSLAKSIDIVSPWKSPYGSFGIVKGVAIPQLTLESVSYRFGLRDNAGEQWTLRGDGIFYVPGTPVQQIEAGDGSTTAFAFDSTALEYQDGGTTRFALNVSVNGTRQTLGTDYTETSGGVTFTTAPANLAVISLVYGTATAGTYAQSVHEGLSVKPAAIKGKDIEVYFSTVTATASVTNAVLNTNEVTLTTGSAHGYGVGDTVVVSGIGAPYDGTYTTISGTSGTSIVYSKTNANVATAPVTGTASKTVEIKWPDVQSVNIDWRVTLEDDYEFGNSQAISKEATDVPAVTGSVELRPRDVNAFFTRLVQITGVDAADVIGPQSSVAGALRIVLKNPESGGTTAAAAGAVLKTIYVPAARFTLPGFEGRVQQKLNVTLNLESDDGVMYVYKGDR